MKKELNINVREIQREDIGLVTDYWLNSDPDFLVAMGVDLKKLPTRKELIQVLTQQIENSLDQKQSYALIWELNGEPVGHCNVNQIIFGQEAFMHLHLWKHLDRKNGMGSHLVRKSLSLFFEKLELEIIYCEPYTLNPAPNKTLAGIGFEFEKRYETIPGTLNFKQEVNRWKLTREKYMTLTSP